MGTTPVRTQNSPVPPDLPRTLPLYSLITTMAAVFSVPEHPSQECLTSGAVRWVAYRAGSLHPASCPRGRVVASRCVCEVAFHPRLEQSLHDHRCVGSPVNAWLHVLGMNTREWRGQVIGQVHVYFIRSTECLLEWLQHLTSQGHSCSVHRPSNCFSGSPSSPTLGVVSDCFFTRPGGGVSHCGFFTCTLRWLVTLTTVPRPYLPPVRPL